MTRTPEREQFLADIICCAVEGGVNYWATVSVYKWMDGPSTTTATLHDMEDPDTPLVVTLDTVAHGLSLIREGGHVNEYMTASIRDADHANDAGMIDSGDADAIVQAGLFDEVIFG